MNLVHKQAQFEFNAEQNLYSYRLIDIDIDLVCHDESYAVGFTSPSNM